MKVGIVAGEASGDILGAGLVGALRERVPGVEFRGIAGPRMRAAGVHALFDAEELSVMGLVEVLGRLPRLLSIRRQLLAAMAAWRPDVFVGVDSPDFNLPVETRLRAGGTRTVHYVSPTVWAWRPGRTTTIERAADELLCLFPFEPDHYAKTGLRATYVGHPLADLLSPLSYPRDSARSALALATDAPVIAILPGSRGSELRHLGVHMADAVALLAQRRPQPQFVAPMVDDVLQARFGALLERRAPAARVALVREDSRMVMAAADVVLAASGTATLEAMLLERPMVVAYRLAPVTAWVLRTFGMLGIDRFSIPNVLADATVVPELLQERATGAAMAAAVTRLLDQPDARSLQVEALRGLAGRLRAGADARAAEAVLAAAKV